MDYKLEEFIIDNLLNYQHGIHIDDTEKKLYLSNDFNQNKQVLNLVSYAQRKNLGYKVIWTSLSTIQDLKEAGKISHSSVTSFSNSDIEDLAVDIFKNAVAQKASDIHIINNLDTTNIRFRIYGDLETYKTNLPPELVRKIMTVIFSTMADGGTSPTYTENNIVDAIINKRQFLPEELYGIRVHSDPIYVLRGIGNAMVLRLIPRDTEEPRGLEIDLRACGYADNQINDLISMTYRSGINMFSGKTGSGKSYSLQQVLKNLAKMYPKKQVRAIEDPPEYEIKGVIRVCISETDPNKKYQAYMDHVNSSLRGDPDILMFGEMRYPEVVTCAIDAVHTGHGLWTTIHASGALLVLNKLEAMLNQHKRHSVDTICEPEIISGIIYQNLIQTICDHCKIPIKKAYENKMIPESIFSQVQKICQQDDIDNIFITNPKGCPHCKKGVSGQTVAAETILPDNRFLELYRNKELNKMKTYWKDNLGGKTILEHAIEHIKNGRSDPFEVVKRLQKRLVE